MVAGLKAQVLKLSQLAARTASSAGALLAPYARVAWPMGISSVMFGKS